MIDLILATSLLSCPQTPPPVEPGRRPASRPTSRPHPAPDDVSARLLPAAWPENAPGTQVLRRPEGAVKLAPLRSAPYTNAEKAAARVRPEDLVLGLEVAGKAVAYPINMLGGPQREIVNEDYGGVAFAVNW